MTTPTEFQVPHAGYHVDPVSGKIVHDSPRDPVQLAQAEASVTRAELAVTKRELTAARTELAKLKEAVRDKAQEVYDNAEAICLDGTNEWLRSLGLGELKVRTNYRFRVPVTIELVIQAEDETTAREVLGSHYDDKGDSDDVDTYELIRQDPSWDWFKKIEILESWPVDREDY